MWKFHQFLTLFSECHVKVSMLSRCSFNHQSLRVNRHNNRWSPDSCTLLQSGRRAQFATHAWPTYRHSKFHLGWPTSKELDYVLVLPKLSTLCAPSREDRPQEWSLVCRCHRAVIASHVLRDKMKIVKEHPKGEEFVYVVHWDWSDHDYVSESYAHAYVVAHVSPWLVVAAHGCNNFLVFWRNIMSCSKVRNCIGAPCCTHSHLHPVLHVYTNLCIATCPNVFGTSYLSVHSNWGINILVVQHQLCPTYILHSPHSSFW